MDSIEIYQQMFEGRFSEKEYYRTFLVQTDHIPNKIQESFIELFETITSFNFVVEVIKWGLKTFKDNKEMLGYRKYAREQINRLEK